MQRQHRTAGFTLIELMTVVAVVAILAAMGIMQYQIYVARSQATAALSDITPGRTAYETLVNQGVVDGDTYANASNLGLQQDTPRCTISTTVPVQGQGMIRCVMKGNPTVQNKHIDLNRDANGAWSCSSDLDSRYLPRSCTTAA